MMYPLAATLIVSLLAFTAIWLIHVGLRDAGVVDYYWGPGFAVIALVHGWFSGFTVPAAILTVAVLLWSARLSGYLIARHRKSRAEDARYAAMRQAGGPSFWWKSLFSIFLLQGFLQWAIASPLHAVFAGSQTGDASAPLFIFGMSLFAAGFVVESVADFQLARFKNASDAPGRLMTGGLWRLSRHPNYLGEMILWTGVGLAAFSATHSPFALAGPVILALAMIFVSAPLTEDHLTKSRPQFEAYAARTPMLVPRLGALFRARRA
jgi:steroid 5-alpha reductase family enzyme